MKTLPENMAAYIKRRAEHEGVEFDLSLEWFEEVVEIAPKILGVIHDGEQMLSDEQEPYAGFFSETVAELSV